MKFFKYLLFIVLIASQQASAQRLPNVIIDSVSVLDDNRVQIAWQVPNDNRVDGYYIYRLYENNFGETKFLDPIEASANGRLTKSFIYTDNTGNIDLPSQKALRFFVVALDKDVNPAQQSLLDTLSNRPHQTVFLNQNIDPCNASVNLFWTPYNTTTTGFSSGISRYEVWESQNGGSFRLIYSGNNTSLTRRGLLSNINYQYKIRVASGDLAQTSTSNRKTFTGSFAKAPNYVYLNNATVSTNNRDIALSWLVDSASVRLTYQIMMSTDSVNFNEVARLDSVDWNITQGRYTQTITGLATERNNYFFKVITSCACPDTIDTTAITKVVRLDAIYVDPTTNYISWNDYSGWISGTGYFQLFRVILDPVTLTQNTELIATLLPNQLDYTDNDPAIAGADNNTSYFIRAFEQVGNPLITGIQSQSNFAYVYREVKIIVPDAFTPNGLNPIFLPQIQTTANTTFNMKIYNRWGKLVFETNNEFEGWNGKDKDSGDVCLPGSYVYLIKANDSTGKTMEKVGNVALLD